MSFKKNGLNRNKKTLSIVLVILVFISLCLAYYTGLKITQDNNTQLISAKYPGLQELRTISNELFMNTIGESKYFSIGESIGYGGPIKIIVITDSTGAILQADVLDHKETDSYLKKVLKNHYFDQFTNKSYQDFSFIKSLDGISGATKTCDGIKNSVYFSLSNISSTIFEIDIPALEKPDLMFGLPELILIILFIIGILTRANIIKFRKTIRWISLITGLIVFGFIYSTPLTIGKLNTFLLGYQSYWQENVFWYILIFGIILLLLFTNKNAYCFWFCPFGAAQDCLGEIGKAKPLNFTGKRKIMKSLPGLLSWIVIVSTLIFRNPGATSYEIFGAFFNITGSTILFILLSIVLILSLFVQRPWCNYLCPVSPVFNYIGKVRNLILEPWRKK